MNHSKTTLLPNPSLLRGWIFTLIFLGACSQLEPAPTFTELYTDVIQKTGCADCHTPGGSGTLAGVQLDFSTQAQAYSTLLNKSVTGTTSVGICSGVAIVTEGRPESSYLAAVLIPSYQISDFGGVSGCTPLNTHTEEQYLTSAQQTQIEKWISAGANND